VLPPNAGSSYQRFKTHERPSAIVAAVVWITDGEIAGSRVVAGSVGNRPQRLTAAEALLGGSRASPDLFQAASEAAKDQVAIEEEGFESIGYKRHLIGVLTAKALRQAGERAA
jgi:carbon-monoxide dehydrogenase medium subunit